MDIGIACFPTDGGIGPGLLACAAEERGFHSLFVAEHTHIPASRATPWPGGGDIPRAYSHLLDPFVALGAMAAVTERITLGTGVSLVNQHHPISLAKRVASVDYLARGRFEFGVGTGWNREEMANHDVEPRHRTAAMLERIEAIRAIWTHDEAEFHGEFVDFDPIWCWPKPSPAPPILVGGNGPGVLERVLSHGDGWLPTRVRLAELDVFAERVAKLRRMSADRGRGHLPVVVFDASPGRGALEAYADAGVDRVLFSLPDHDDVGAVRATLADLDRFASLLSGW